MRRSLFPDKESSYALGGWDSMRQLGFDEEIKGN